MSFELIPKLKTKSANMTVECSTHLDAASAAPKIDSIQTEMLDFYGLPHQDHNYGAPPSIPGHSQMQMCSDNDVDYCDIFSEAPIVTIKATSSHLQNGMKESLETKSGDLTRCICGFIHDDGYMICCDRCSVWQHIDCMEINRNDIPDAYLCELCNPRLLDAERATRLQHMKHEEFLSGTDLDSDNSSMDASSDISMSMRESRGITKQLFNMRKRSADNNTITNNYHDGRKRPRSKSFQTNGSEEDYERMKCVWNMKIRQWTKSYQEADGRNKYADCIQEAIKSAMVNNNQPDSSIEPVVTCIAPAVKVQECRGSLIAMEDIIVNKSIIEYQGCFTLTKKFEVPIANMHERPYPYVLFYNGFHGIDVCVDSRTFGNRARYIRRSCTPNAEVRHSLTGGLLKLHIFSVKLIEEGTEITIPFDLEPENCAYSICCACSKEDCLFIKSRTKSFFGSSLNCFNNMHQFHQTRLFEETCCKGQPGKCGCSKQDNQFQVADSESQKKMSREERKMEAYIRAFENLEKRQKRRESLHQQAYEKPSPNTTEHEPQQLIPQDSNTQPAVVSRIITMVVTSTENFTSRDGPDSIVSTPVPVVAPKLDCRRQSKRARRPSAKLIDASGGTRNAFKAKGELNSSLLAVSEDSCGAANREVEKLLSPSEQSICSDFMSLDCEYVQRSSSSSMNASDPPLLCDMISQSSSNFPATDSIFLPVVSFPNNQRLHSSELSNVEFADYEEENSQTVAASESLTFLSSMNQNHYRPLVTSPWSTDIQELPPAQTFCRSLPPFTVDDLKPVFANVSCTFVNWDFKPGEPSGIVPISSIQYNKPRKRYSPTKYVKKWWLKRAVCDSLAVSLYLEENPNNFSMDNDTTSILEFESEHECAPHIDNNEICQKQPVIHSIMSWKKKLVRGLTVQKMQIPVSVSELTFNDRCNVDDDVIVMAETSVSASSSEHEDEEVSAFNIINDEENESMQHSILVEIDSSISTAHKSSTCFDETLSSCVDAEETLSEEFFETKIDAVSMNSLVSASLDLTNVDDSSSSSIKSMYSLDQENDDVEYVFDDTSCELSEGDHENMDEIKRAASTKRKVSLQEYLKRYKEGDKPLITSMSSAFTVVRSSAMPSTLSVDKMVNIPEVFKKKKTSIVKSDLHKEVITKVINVLGNDEKMIGLMGQMVKRLKQNEMNKVISKSKEVLVKGDEKLHSLSTQSKINPVPLKKSFSPRNLVKNSSFLKTKDSGLGATVFLSVSSPMLDPPPLKSPPHSATVRGTKEKNLPGNETNENCLEQNQTLLSGSHHSSGTSGTSMTMSPLFSSDPAGNSKDNTLRLSEVSANSKASVVAVPEPIVGQPIPTIPSLVRSDGESSLSSSQGPVPFKYDQVVKSHRRYNRSPFQHSNGYEHSSRTNFGRPNSSTFSNWEPFRLRNDFPRQARYSSGNGFMDNQRYYTEPRHYSEEYHSPRRSPSPLLSQYRCTDLYEYSRGQQQDSFASGNPFNRLQNVRKSHPTATPTLNHSPPPILDKPYFSPVPFSSESGYRKQWRGKYRM